MLKKDPKIIQSYWSKPGIEHTGWSNKSFHFLSWILSCLKLKEHYQEVELITDNLGKIILIDILKLPYDHVSLKLNDLQEFNERIWTLGKLLSYSIQRCPFIHVDGDVFIWEKLPFNNEALFAQHKETRFAHNKCFLTLLQEKGYIFPDTIHLDDSNVNEVNAGLLGGNDLSFFTKYTHTAFQFLHTNRTKINSLKASNEVTAVNTIMEQFFFCQLAEHTNRQIQYLFKEDEVKDDYVRLVDFPSVPHKSTYIHPVGYHKKNPVIGEYISRILYYEYPCYFNVFQNHKKQIYELCR